MAESNTPHAKDHLFVNKVLGSILATCLGVMVINELGHVVYHPEELEEAAYVIEVKEGTSSGGGEEEVVDLATLLASADISRGERVSRKCTQCHTFDNGGKNGTGPNLWNIVGAPSARIAGFNYSKAMQEFGGTWDFQALYDYLESPRGLIKGTNMSFAGLRKPEDRANMIAFLRDKSDNPVPLPVPPAAPAPEEADVGMVEDAAPVE